MYDKSIFSSFHSFLENENERGFLSLNARSTMYVHISKFVCVDMMFDVPLYSFCKLVVTWSLCTKPSNTLSHSQHEKMEKKTSGWNRKGNTSILTFRISSNVSNSTFPILKLSYFIFLFFSFLYELLANAHCIHSAPWNSILLLLF